MEQQAKYAIDHTRVRPDVESVSRLNPATAFADNRPRTASLHKLAEAMDNSPRVVAQRKLAEALNRPRTAQQAHGRAQTISANEPIQRQVPQGGETSKPIAITGSYQARGGQSTRFDAEKHPRTKFSFGTKTRDEVFQNWNPQYAGNRITTVRVASGEQANVEGVQLDHKPVAWTNIENAMTTHNNSMTAQNQTNASLFYSLWDAKMYYNDQTNLQPALGNLNASGGSQGALTIPRIHYGLESVMGTAATSWLNLQSGINAVGDGMSEDAVLEVAELMGKVTQAMNEVTDRLF